MGITSVRFWLAVLTAAFLTASAGAAERPPAEQSPEPSERDEAAAFVEQVRADTTWLASFPTRVVGLQSHDEAQKELLDKIKAIPGVRMWTQEFPVVMPRFLESELRIPAGPAQGKHHVYPLWPACGRLNTTPRDGISGRLIYIGKGEPGRLPGHCPASSLRGQVAVMEMAGGDAWSEAYNAGAQAIILLGSPAVTSFDVSSHVMMIPINVPRFYVPDGSLADALRTGKAGDGTLYARGDWAAATARNIYVLVKPTGKRPDAIELQQAFVIAVAYDSMSVVPELAPGADAALDVAAALNLLRQYSRTAPARPLLFAFLDAYTINQLGVRQMLGSFATVPKDRKEFSKEDAELLGTYRKHAQLAEELFISSTVPREIQWLNTVLLCLGGLAFFATFLWFVQRRRFVLCGVPLVFLIIEMIIVASNYSNWVRVEAKVKPRPAILNERDGLNRFHESRFRDLRRYIKDEVARDIAQNESELYPVRLKASELGTRRRDIYEEMAGLKKRADSGPERKKADDQTAALLAELTDINDKLKDLDKVQDRLRKSTAERNSVQRQLFSSIPLGDESVALAHVLWTRASQRIAGQLKSLEGTAAQDRQRDLRRGMLLRELGLPEKIERPLGFIFGIDLSDSGVAAGPSLQDRFHFINESRNAESFRRWMAAKQRQDGDRFWPADVRHAVNLNPLSGMESAAADVVGLIHNITSPAVSFATAGITWSTLEAIQPRTDTPNDTAARLDWSRIEPQLKATRVLLGRLIADPAFLPNTKEVASWTRAHGAIVDESPGDPVPRVPMEGYLTTLVSGSQPVPGLRRLEFALTGIDGQFQFDLLPSASGVRGFSVQSFLTAEDGRIVRAIDALKAGRGVTLTVDLSASNPGPMRAVVFDCGELNLPELFDPRYLLGLPAVSVLDAIRGSNPQRMNLGRYGNKLTCLLEPGVRWQLILRRGIAANRMVLLNVLDTKDPEVAALPVRKIMVGFPLGERLPLDPVHISARDFYRLDFLRLSDYRKAGITSKPIEEMQKRTEVLLAGADDALKHDDGAGYVKNTSGALANEVRIYEAVLDTAKDVIRGAIFLLLMIVPFSFVMERLLFASPHIYKQLGAIIGIFAVMAAVLWSFHPAFRISGHPLMIIMAFGAIGMSVMVISMIFSKFESELEELRSGRAESSGARTSRLGLAYTALRLGIANMRKRKLRTALTAATVILITFALLCFMSASSYHTTRDSTVRTKASFQPAFAGVLIALPANREMAPQALRALETITPPGRTVAPTYWLVNPWDTQWRIHVRNGVTGKQVSLKAALGVSASDGPLVGFDKVCSNWPRFAAGNACYLSSTVAEELGVKPGDKVILGGVALELLGTFQSKAFDETVMRLDGTPMRPFDFTAVGDEQRQMMTRSGLEELMEDIESGKALERAESLPYTPSDGIVVAPASVVRRLGGGLRSISIAAPDYATAQDFAKELSERFAFPIYYGAPGQGVRVVVGVPPLPHAPKSLLIPLAIAGLIILNTMLSSIAERKREIYIYTSLGLAPLHVGFLFLAEAITYGLMGSIFGYVAGQGVAKVLSEMGWMGGITLNYSGTQAIITMIMVLGVVIVSSLVPAFLAGKLAAPSNEMTWRVPQPQDDVIRDRLPFTATTRTAAGVLEFLYEYMDAHREGTIGNFSADDLRKIHENANGVDVIGLEGTVWLAPYDLGIRQDVRILIQPSAEADIYEINIELRRQSGQVSSWWKLNRVLLGDLRRQLLGWRKLKIDRMLEYITRAAESGTPLVSGPPA